jgi:hypothetical protein
MAKRSPCSSRRIIAGLSAAFPLNPHPTTLLLAAGPLFALSRTGNLVVYPGSERGSPPWIDSILDVERLSDLDENTGV